MTIQKAIEMLVKIRDKHGDIEVYFDCPFCSKAASPNQVVATATVKGKSDA